MTYNFPLDAIMLIDDDEATNFLNQMTLEAHGLCREVQVYHKATDALHHLSNLNATGKKRPNLILLDVNMPGMNGWEFLEEYQKLDEQSKCDILVVMLTTSLNPDDRERAQQIDVIDEFLSKPLQGEQLVEILQSILE